MSEFAPQDRRSLFGGLGGGQSGLADLRWVIHRQIVPIVTVIVAILTLTAIVLWRMPDRYSARAAMALTVSEARISRTNSQLEVFDLTSARVQTEIDVLRSRDFAADVAASLDLYHNPEFTNSSATAELTPDLKAQVIDRLLGSYALFRTGESLVINVDAEAGSPQLAAAIANAVVATYIRNSAQDERDQIEELVNFLRERVTHLNDELSSAEVVLATIIRTSNLDDVDLPTRLLSERDSAAGILSVLKSRHGSPEEIAAREAEVASLENRLSQRTRAELSRKRQERIVDLLSTRYQTATERLNELEPQLELVSQGARQVTVAEIPTEPSAPNRPATLAIATAASLLMAFLLALMLSSSNRQIWTDAQAQEVSGQRNLGHVPKLRSRGPFQMRMPGWILQIPPFSSFSEAMRSILMIWMKSAAKAGHKVLMIGSPLPGDGKSTIAAAMAVTAAKDGLRVLLLDFDQHRAQVYRHVGASAARVEVEALLADPDQLAGKFQKIGHTSSFDFMALSVANRWTARLIDEFAAQIMPRLRDAFDLVILDTPPVLATADACRIGAMADEVLLVVRAGKTGTRALAISVDRLLTSGAQIAGTIVNAVEASQNVSDYGGGNGLRGYGTA